MAIAATQGADSQPPLPNYKSNHIPSFFMSAKEYRVYVIENHQSRRYISISDDVNRRLADHNSGISQ